MARPKPSGRTDWNQLAVQTDRQIRRAVRSDPDAAPIAPADWIRKARLLEPKPKKAVSVRLDEDVLAWFRRGGKGYQTRINAVLRAYVESQR